MIWSGFVLRFGTSYTEGGFLALVLLGIKVFGEYLKITFWPFDLSLTHTLPGGFVVSVIRYKVELQNLLSKDLIIVIPSLLLTVFYAIKNFKQKPLLAFCLFWFCISLLPVMNVFFNFNMYERFLYIPLFGFALFYAFVLGKIYNIVKIRQLRKKVFFAALLVFIALYSFATFQRNEVWRSEVLLWGDTVKKSPTSVFAYSKLGNAYNERGENELAKQSYQKAIELSARKGDRATYVPWVNLASVYSQEKDYDKATEIINQALKLYPNNYNVYYGAGFIYESSSNPTEARKFYELALQSKPADPKATQRLSALKSQ